MSQRIVFGPAVKAEGLLSAWFALQASSKTQVQMLGVDDDPQSSDYSVDRPPHWLVKRFLWARPSILKFYVDHGLADVQDRLVDFVERLDRSSLSDREQALRWTVDLQGWIKFIGRQDDPVPVMAIFPKVLAMFDYAWEMFQEQGSLPIVADNVPAPWIASREMNGSQDPAIKLQPIKADQSSHYQVIDGPKVLVFHRQMPGLTNYLVHPYIPLAIAVSPRSSGKQGFHARIERRRYSTDAELLEKIQNVLQSVGETWVSPERVGDLLAIVPQRGVTALDRWGLLGVIAAATHAP